MRTGPCCRPAAMAACDPSLRSEAYYCCDAQASLIADVRKPEAPAKRGPVQRYRLRHDSGTNSRTIGLIGTAPQMHRFLSIGIILALACAFAAEARAAPAT